MKKYFSLLLALSLFLGMLTGASSLAEDKPTVITIGSVATFPAEWLTFAAMQKLQSDLNIQLDYIQYDDDNFNLMLASGDLPDIVVGKQVAIPSIINNKMALNIDPLLEEYAPNLLRDEYANTASILREMMGGPEKALYFFAPNVGTENGAGGISNTRGYILRWDYYKEMGAPEIKNDDDYLAVIKALAEKYPTTADGKKTYGIGVESSLGDMGGYRASFTMPVLSNPWSFSGYKYTSSFLDATLYNGYTDLEHSAYWTDMAFYNRIHREGLFDPDSFTMSYDEYASKVAAGTYMGLYYADGSLYNEAVLDDPQTTSGFIAIPSEGAMSMADKLAILGNAPTYYSFISASSDNWEKCLAIYNTLYDPDFNRLAYSGEQGVHWDYDDEGVPYIFEEALAMKQSNDPEWKAAGYGSVPFAFIGFNETGKHPDGEYYNLFQMAAYRGMSLNPLQQDFCAYYELEYPTQGEYKLAQEGIIADMSNDCGQTISAGVSDIPMDIKRIMDNCNDIIYRAMPKLIMAETEEAYLQVQQDVLAQLEEADEATAWAWCLDAWNASKDVILPIFNNARDALN